MSDMLETRVEVTTRTAQEGLVVVPEACYEKCKALAGLIGEAAIAELDGKFDAVVCDDRWQQRRHTFPRKCPAIRAHFSFEGAVAVSPFIVGEGETKAWVDRVDEAIEEQGALGIVAAYKKTNYK